MNTSHLFAGGGASAAASALTVWALSKTGVHLSTEDGVIVGASALAAGTGIASRVEKYGVRGLLTGLWKGAASAK